MCNRYNIKTNLSLLGEKIHAVLPIKFDFSGHVVPRSTAPGILLNQDGERELHPMRFGLIPRGARELPEQAYNNARVENIEKWPWKLSLPKHRCVLPLSAFREPCYWGEPAGKEVYFRAPDEPLLLVAGLYNVWQNEVTMTFLMRPAGNYVMEHGHHRQPFFIKHEGIDDWMTTAELGPDEAGAILRKHAAAPELTHEVDREMAAAWKGRQKDRLRKRDEQLDEIQRTGLPLGF